MTKTELCSMCDEFSTTTKCENEDTCRILKLLNENTQLKLLVAEIREYINCEYPVDSDFFNRGITETAILNRKKDLLDELSIIIETKLDTLYAQR